MAPPSGCLCLMLVADPRCGPRTTGIASNTRLNSWITAVIHHETRTIHSPNTFHAPSSAGMPGVDAPRSRTIQHKAPLPRRGRIAGRPPVLAPRKVWVLPPYWLASASTTRLEPKSNVGARRWACPPLTGRQTPRTRRSPWQRCANPPRQEAADDGLLALFDELDAQRRTGDLGTCRARQDHRRSRAAESPSSRTTPAAARPHESQADG